MLPPPTEMLLIEQTQLLQPVAEKIPVGLPFLQWAHVELTQVLLHIFSCILGNLSAAVRIPAFSEERLHTALNLE